MGLITKPLILHIIGTYWNTFILNIGIHSYNILETQIIFPSFQILGDWETLVPVHQYIILSSFTISPGSSTPRGQRYTSSLGISPGSFSSRGSALGTSSQRPPALINGAFVLEEGNLCSPQWTPILSQGCCRASTFKHLSQWLQAFRPQALRPRIGQAKTRLRALKANLRPFGLSSADSQAQELRGATPLLNYL